MQNVIKCFCSRQDKQINISFATYSAQIKVVRSDIYWQLSRTKAHSVACRATDKSNTDIMVGIYVIILFYVEK